MKNKLEEKAKVTITCKTLSSLIDSLADLYEEFGDMKVGSTPNLNPSIDLKFFDYNNPIIILD